jgi:diguanylate cyclase (GGDEF)-like protein
MTGSGGYDSVTGLLSVRGFREILEELQATAPVDETVWLLCADIDDLKSMNDQHGHLAVDEYLGRVAELLRRLLPLPHRLARLGGDEFGALLVNVSMGEVGVLGDRICRALKDFDDPLQRTITVGIAGWLPERETTDDALRRADTALYRAKCQGGNCVYVSGTDDRPGPPPWPRSER